MVYGATLTEMINNKEVTTVKQMVEAISAGDRPLERKGQDGEDWPEKFVQMYDMITVVDDLKGKQEANDDDVLAAHMIDPYCKQMKQLIKGDKSTRVSSEKLFSRCKWQQPYHIVDDEGILRRLLWKRGNKADVQVQEGRAPAVVQENAQQLQIKLCETVHAEGGHNKSPLFDDYSR